MTLKSMTGFARTDGALADARWHWELRSVNGRGLDVRTRLAPGTEALELKVREIVARHVVRGNVSVTLTLQRDAGTSELRLNEAALAKVLEAMDRVRRAGDFDKPRPEGVLALRGVLEVAEPVETEAQSEVRHRAILADLEQALVALGQHRAGEGERLGAVLFAQLNEIEAIVARVAAAPARAPEALKARLVELLLRVLDAAPGLDPARLHQEAALLATKVDVAEELDRLTAHIAGARELLATKEPVGRKLDFLAQEFNREANTLCSKANAVEITRAGLELKAIIDQMREQVQNIE